MTAASPLAVLLLQITAIIVIAKLTAALVARAGQAALLGELLGGILLRRSFVGLLWPSIHRALFPADATATLHLFSQIGVILFMFLVGCELDLTPVTRNARTAVLVSYAGIALSWVIFE